MLSPIETWKSVLKKKSYDVVFSYGTLIYLNSLEEVSQVLESMAGILSTGGLMILGEINDSANKHIADGIRKDSHKTVEELSKELDVDHLYIPKQLFIDFASDKFDVSFLPLPQWYPASKYRYHVVLKSKESI